MILHTMMMFLRVRLVVALVDVRLVLGLLLQTILQHYKVLSLVCRAMRGQRVRP